MTKKEIIEALAKYDDGDIIYNANGAYDSVNLANGYDYASILRDRDIAWVEGRRDREFSEMEDAQARITIANAKLAKKETKRWRIELERATKLLNYHKGMYDSAVSRVDYYNRTTVSDYMKTYKLV